MSALHTYRTGIVLSLSDSVDAAQHDVELIVRYTVRPGCEVTREQPGEGPSIEFSSATISQGYGLVGFGRKNYDAPDWLWTFIEKDEELQAELLSHAEQMDEYARDQVADAKREEQMLERGR